MVRPVAARRNYRNGNKIKRVIRSILPMGYYLRKCTGIALAGLIWIGLCSSAFGQKLELVILTSDTLTSTQRTLHGLQKAVRSEHPEAEFPTFQISKNPFHNQEIVDSIRTLNPRLILTVGSPATSIAKENFDDLPIVFSGVKYPSLSGFVDSTHGSIRNMTGASLDIPTDIQFNCFRQIVPGIKRIGVLYTDNTASLIPHARIVARSLNIELIALRVASEKDLPEVLDSLSLLVDGIWSVADHNLFGPRSTRYILLNTVRKGIPFMGFSRHVVESGALFALDFDYKAVGIQAGNIVNRILAGESPVDIEVTSADVIWFHYNENTAKRINIEIPAELASVAKEVYR
ncbi:MAG: ABC transporter substrate-binding protein [Candidatus Zixiibacteriota bacterium]|nr:MAG: ABC transporter substrate-binding protein [candidate division Zixibacteria bacterium]